MNRILCRAVSLLAVLCAGGSVAQAQQPANCESVKAEKSERLEGGDRVLLFENVEIRCGNESFFADQVELQNELDRIVAIGNVVFTSGGSRISAERAEFDTKARTGTFFNAWGTASLGSPEVDEERSQFGTQEIQATAV